MRKANISGSNEPKPKRRPPMTPEAEEDQLINLASNLARQQLEDGTASSQVITHYLKLGAEKEKRRLETEILEKQRDLVAAKTEDLRSKKQSEEFYERVISALRSYNGIDDDDECQDIL